MISVALNVCTQLMVLTRTDDPEVASPPLTVGVVDLIDVLFAGERIVSEHDERRVRGLR